MMTTVRCSSALLSVSLFMGVMPPGMNGGVITIDSENTYDPDSSSYVWELMLSSIGTIAASFIILICAVVWSVCICKGKYIPGDISEKRAKVYSAISGLAALLIAALAAMIIYTAIELEDVKDDMSATVESIAAWEPTAFGIVDLTSDIFETAILTHAQNLQTIDFELASDVQFNLTAASNELVNLKSAILSVEGDTMASLFQDFTKMVDKQIPIMYTMCALALFVGIGSLINILTRVSCYPTEYFKRKKALNQRLMFSFQFVSCIGIGFVLAGLVMVRMATIASADFCADFSASLKRAIYYQSAQDAATSTANGSPFLNYYLDCNSQNISSVFDPYFARMELNISMAQHSLGTIESSGFNLTLVEQNAIALTNNSIELMSSLLGSSAEPGNSSLFDALGCDPLASNIDRLESFTCDEISNIQVELLLYCAAIALTLVFNFVLTMRTPIMDVNVHAVPDNSFGPLGGTREIVNQSFRKSEDNYY